MIYSLGANNVFKYELINVLLESTTSTNNINAGSKIIRLLVDVSVAYDEGITFSLGTESVPNYLLATTDLDITETGITTFDFDASWATTEPIVVTITGVPTTGAMSIYCFYC